MGNKGKIEAPHPKPLFAERQQPIKVEGPIMEEIRESLKDVKRDIDLNYRRVHYGNPVVNHMLKMISGILGQILVHLDFEEVDNTIEGMHELGKQIEDLDKTKKIVKDRDKKMTFGTTKEGIQ